MLLALAVAAPVVRAQDVAVPVGDLPQGDSITIEFTVTVDNPVPPGTTQVCNQGTVAGDNFSPDVDTDDPATGTPADPTCTALLIPIDLEVSKAESVDPVVAGSGAGNLTHVVTVFNNSANFATGVALSESVTVPAGVTVDSIVPSQGSFVAPTWTVGTLAPLGSATLTITYTASASAAAGTDVICDTATVIAFNESEIDPGDNSDTECTSIAREIDLQVSKTESADPVIAGSGAGNLTYVVTVANAGPSDATGVTLSEVLTLPAGVTVDSVTPSQGGFVDPTWTVGDLAAGASATLTVVLTVGPSAPEGTDVVCDTATVTAANETLINTGDDAATECTSVERQVDLQGSKTESVTQVIAGSGPGNLTHVVTVENAGPSDASGLTYSDVIDVPPGVTIDSVTPSQGTFVDPVWTVGDLPAGASATLTVVYTVGPSATQSINSICDTATVTGINETRINTGDDGASECTSITRRVDIQLSKTESVDPAVAGSGAGNLTHVLTVTNAGPSDASGLRVNDVVTVPAGVTVDSITPSQGTFAPPEWNINILPAGASATLTVVFTVGPAAAPGTDVICDAAAVSGLFEFDTDTSNNSASECTSITIAADLAITKVDDVDPVPSGQDLTYTLTVENLGPSNATGVVVTDPLPAAVTYVSDTCGGSDVPPWTWNVGNLAVGASVSCDVVVSINPTPPASITNTATVTGNEIDGVAGNNSASETTTLDAIAPTVTKVDSFDPTTDGEITECETATVSIRDLLVTFSEAMSDPPGDGGAGDVTNPANYLLVHPGADLDLTTTSCAGLAGDDVAVAVAGVLYDAGERTATLDLFTGLAASQYRLLVCGTLTDAAGNALDGDDDGDAGGDFQRNFRADYPNLFANGHFDCDVDGWSSTPPGVFVHDPADAGGAGASGSATAANLFGGSGGPVTWRLGQCVPAVGGAVYRLATRVRLDTPQAVVSLENGCELFTGPACTGSTVVLPVEVLGAGSTGGAFSLSFERSFTTAAGTRSLRCAVGVRDAEASTFEVFFDDLSLTRAPGIFADGFETGDAGRWSGCVGCP